MLQVYTSTIRNSDPDRLDVTIKSGDKAFSPTWDMVTRHKNGTLTDEHYIAMYRLLMLISWKKNRWRWDELLQQDRVVLVCYCPAGAFCHRVLLAEMLEKLGAKYCGEI